jgi:hypothetical protein
VYQREALDGYGRVVSDHDDIARRVAESIPSETTYAEVAKGIRITADELARSLNRERVFSSVELALLGDVLGVDVHWLITGNPDPYRLVHACGSPIAEERERVDRPIEMENLAAALGLDVDEFFRTPGTKPPAEG